MANTKAKKPVKAKTTKTKKTETVKVSKGPIIVIIAALVLIASVITTIIVCVINKQPNVVGKYTLVSTINANGEEDTSAADAFKLFGAKYTIEFKDDKTGVMGATFDGSGLSSLFTDNNSENDSTTGSIVNFTYDKNSIKTQTDEGEKTYTYTYKDGVITITMNEETMNFKRDEEQPSQQKQS